MSKYLLYLIIPYNKNLYKRQPYYYIVNREYVNMRYLQALWMGVISFLAFGSLPPKYSSVHVIMTPILDKTIVEFFVVPHKDMEISPANLWKLTITSKGTTKTIDQFDPKIPGFFISIPSQGEGLIHYKLQSFVCTKDKKHCYSEIHRGSFNAQFVAYRQ